MNRKRVFFGLLVIFTFSARLWAGTFFLYIEETCNGERGLFLSGAREGILDTFFESDQIIYDDLSDKGKGRRIESGDVLQPLADARRGGADFLLAVAIQSTVKKSSPLPKAPENIKSSCAYYLYEVGTGRLLAQGTLSLEKEGLADENKRDELGFELGRLISQALGEFYNR